ncbi:DUF4268 domain-containing protein [Pedobacter polaris]|uniref:DUF4268 domain-containing protein n=1 Tax=Pedobacter polaris TaxID=2571273 RepID=A0A4U1CR85_9SPHI|nr:DUF4268 domain-containing protein [Pedobacter polaris]TKC08262.1 DUF4268 domain-containing protein [Pedobacter polaris]
MYSKEEASKLRQQFWITFGKYMKPIPSAEGLQINWVNYKTGVKNVFFRMNAEQKKATISIDITHSDEETRLLFFEQFKAFKLLFTDAVHEEWEWEQQAFNEYGVALSQISIAVTGLSIFNQQNWADLISFLKPRIIALDQFWTDVKPIFEALG